MPTHSDFKEWESIRVTIRSGALLRPDQMESAIHQLGGITRLVGQGGWVNRYGSIIWEDSYSYILTGRAVDALPAAEKIIIQCLNTEDAVLAEFEPCDSMEYTKDNL